MLPGQSPHHGARVHGPTESSDPSSIFQRAAVHPSGLGATAGFAETVVVDKLRAGSPAASRDRSILYSTWPARPPIASSRDALAPPLRLSGALSVAARAPVLARRSGALPAASGRAGSGWPSGENASAWRAGSSLFPVAYRRVMHALTPAPLSARASPPSCAGRLALARGINNRPRASAPRSLANVPRAPVAVRGRERKLKGIARWCLGFRRG